MKKKKLVATIIIVIGIIMLATATILLVPKSKDKQEKPKDNGETYGTDLEKHLTAKAMIYVADNNNYTTENYLIYVEKKDNNYVVTIKTKDNQDVVESITIDKNILQKWKPENASPEGIEVLDQPNSSIDGISGTK